MGTEVDACGAVWLALATAWVARRTVDGRTRADRTGVFVGAAVLLAGVLAGLGRGAPFEVLLSAGTAAALASAGAWVVLAAAAALRDALARAVRCAGAGLAGVHRGWTRWRAARRARHADQEAAVAAARRLDDERRRRQEEERRREEERRCQDEAERARAAARRRREEARARAAIAFNLHAPELVGRFSRAMLDEFAARYMGDDQAPEDVEARSDQVADVIRQHLARARPAAAGLVEAYYREHHDLLRHAYPDPRFRAEMRVRIPPGAPPEDAWRAANDFLRDLQRCADEARDRLGAVRDQLRAVEGQLEDAEERARLAELASGLGGLAPGAGTAEEVEDLLATARRLRRDRERLLGTLDGVGRGAGADRPA